MGSPGTATSTTALPFHASASLQILTSSSSVPADTNGASATPSNKRKRRPAGTPDPEAEVVALSPRTLMESDRYVCEICNQGFQRDQNLQMHRRRHKVPWKLLRKSSSNSNNNNTTGNGNGGSNNNGGNGNGNGNGVVKKRVYVCPDGSCLHNDPAHALGDLVGIKKHFRRKHSADKQWKCERCSKGYAVQSDFKAHLKTCGTRGHSCDCGKVFSRVESFMQHQDSCVVIVAKHNSAALPPLMSKSSKSGPSPAPASAHGHHHFQTEELQLLPKDKPPQAKQKQQQHQRRRHREGGGMSYESSSSTSAYEYEWAAAHEQQPNLELSIGFSSWSSAATVAVAQPLELNGNTVAAASASPASSPKCHHDHDNVLQAAARHYYHASYDNGSLPAHFQYMSMFP